MQPPIGISDFRKLIETRDSEGRPYLFVDKSLLIKEILDDLVEVKLFTRPRRFGKTLNLSMLHHFFAKEVDKKSTHTLFQALEISHSPDYMKYQGQYPVIFLTFKDIKSSTFNAAYEDCIELVRQVYLEHEKEILSPHSKLGERDKKDYELFLDRKASDSSIRGSLKNLTYYLSQHYGIKPIILIDEYDTPIQTAYLGNYYQEMITFMREFLGAGLKDNTHLSKAILTGILRISKESLFPGASVTDLESLNTLIDNSIFSIPHLNMFNGCAGTRLPLDKISKDWAGCKEFSIQLKDGRNFAWTQALKWYVRDYNIVPSREFLSQFTDFLKECQEHHLPQYEQLQIFIKKLASDVSGTNYLSPSPASSTIPSLNPKQAQDLAESEAAEAVRKQAVSVATNVAIAATTTSTTSTTTTSPITSTSSASTTTTSTTTSTTTVPSSSSSQGNTPVQTAMPTAQPILISYTTGNAAQNVNALTASVTTAAHLISASK